MDPCRIVIPVEKCASYPEMHASPKMIREVYKSALPSLISSDVQYNKQIVPLLEQYT
jgi:hypothetical protein